MASVKQSPAGRVIFAGAAVVVAVFLGWWLWGGGPPQLGADEEVFKTVDALFTAVTARDEKLLGACAQRLHAFRESGQLSASAADYLSDIAGQARETHWQAAAETLYNFMRAQRREGAANPPALGR